MKINPNESWYPIPAVPGVHAGEPGVPIRLKLAADFAASLVASWSPETQKGINDDLIGCVMDAGLTMADAMIDRANREENTDGK